MKSAMEAKRAMARHPARLLARAALLPAALALLLAMALPPARPLRARPAQPAQPAIAVACAADTRPLAFALDATGAPLPPAGPNAALDTGNSRLAVTCSALVTLPGAADPLAAPPGSILYTISGPGIAVESGTATYTVACGCAGTPRADGSALPPPEATLHVAIAPGAPLPQAPAPGAITLAATYGSADGALTATAAAAIDLAPPVVRLQLTPHLQNGPDGAPAEIRLAIRVQQALPANCATLAAYLVCARPISDDAEDGAEPGILTLSTTLGTFANGGRMLRITCGVAPATPPVAPLPGVVHPYPLACEGEQTVTIVLAGRAGDVRLSASFQGFYTGATAAAGAELTVPPLPPAYPLQPGCTAVQAPIELPPAAPVALVAESVTPPEAVVAIWRRGRDGRWQLGYARDAAAPRDFQTVDPGDPLTVCVDAPASYPLR